VTALRSDIRVVVADDSSAFRRTLGDFLSKSPGIRVVGEASNADEAVAVTARTMPDVVLLDLVMPRGGGVSAATRIKSGDSAPRVFFVSLLGQRELAHATRMAGVDGYVCKADIDCDLIDLLVSSRAEFGRSEHEKEA
jgi:DNA-binding NarL/FixJ family response regulator